jgi:Ni2+-binding GTPase involved in maturation of urease and hydrogenase
MPKTIRLILVGGFLGAGKTTTLGRLAQHYAAAGKSVGVVTNDQAADLVDTHTLREMGLPVEEVAGSCFCCNFDGLIDAMEKLGVEGLPDIILAEPVGSCTDIVATVLQPIKRLFDARFQVAPYCVILKPSHGRRVLRREPNAGFSPKAAYILEKQLEEADAILINRIDELAKAQIDELTALVETHCENRPVLRISGRTGEGFDPLIEFLGQDGDFGRRVLEIDYDTYADGEAELGWLNSTLRVSAEQIFSLDDFLLDVVTCLGDALGRSDVEVAHLKVIGIADGDFGVANLISSENAPELSLPSHCRTTSADIILNARVACAPEFLEKCVRNTVEKSCRKSSAVAKFQNLRRFRPGRPEPTHRFDAVD